MQLLIKALIVVLGFLICSGVIYAQQSDGSNNSPQKTLEDINQAIRSEPDNADLYRRRGIALKKMGQFNQALVDFSRSIELNPDDAGSYSERGKAYSKLGRFDAAIKDYDRALDLDPQNASIFTYRGASFQKDEKLPSCDRGLQPGHSDGPELCPGLQLSWGRLQKSGPLPAGD